MDFDERLQNLAERIQFLSDRNPPAAAENQTLDRRMNEIMGAIARLVRIAEGRVN